MNCPSCGMRLKQQPMDRTVKNIVSTACMRECLYIISGMVSCVLLRSLSSHPKLTVPSLHRHSHEDCVVECFRVASTPEKDARLLVRTLPQTRPRRSLLARDQVARDAPGRSKAKDSRGIAHRIRFLLFLLHSKKGVFGIEGDCREGERLACG